MHKEHHIWRVWAENLRRWGLQDITAWLIEAVGPVQFLGAQVVYVGQPVLRIFVPDGHITAFAQVLEEPQAAQAFAAYLRKEKAQ
jgi:hypothetical protein